MDWARLGEQLVTVAQVLVAVGLFACSLPRRRWFWARVALVAAAAVGLCVLWPMPAEESLSDVPASWMLLRFVALFVLSMAMTKALFRPSPWGALFCATMGYTVQNLWMAAYRLLGIGLREAGVWTVATPTDPVPQLLTTAPVYLACYLLFARRVRRQQLAFAGDRGLLWVTALVLLFDILYSAMVSGLLYTGLPLVYVVLFAASHLVICLLLLAFEYTLLFSKRMREETAATRRVLERERRQFERSHQNQQAIRIQCHDLKHQIRELESGARSVTPEALEALDREVRLFEGSYRTGNEALDVILCEKGRVCAALGARLNCMADGALLGFLSPADVYALFGNALDNALEAVEALPQEDRVVEVRVRGRGAMVAIQVQNPFAGTVEFVDGLPRTNKADAEAHGFGSLSMRLLAERYGGLMDVRAEGGLYTLSIVLPLPEGAGLAGGDALVDGPGSDGAPPAR